MCAARPGGSAVLLATHAMDEVDAVCSMAAVLVHGEVRTVGRGPQLKAAYGSAYTLTLAAPPLADPSEVHLFVGGLLKGGRVQAGACDGADGYTYQVRRGRRAWSCATLAAGVASFGPSGPAA